MYNIVGSKAIFNWGFNSLLNDEILNDITSCNEIIFNNYNDVDICLMTNNKLVGKKYGSNWKGSKFNQPIDNLVAKQVCCLKTDKPSSIINLTLGKIFNQPDKNLLPSIIS